MSDLKIEPGFAVVMDLVSNCTYRYTQFDGTQALPYKEGGKFHFAGPFSLCSEDTFIKILKKLGTTVRAKCKKNCNSAASQVCFQHMLLLYTVQTFRKKSMRRTISTMLLS
jgi:hypothetical protein